jgi:hypothetical protein
VVGENTETPRGVTEAASNLGTGKPLDEEGAEGLVLAVGGIAGFEEYLNSTWSTASQSTVSR